MRQYDAARPIRHVAGTGVDLPVSLGAAVTIFGKKGHDMSELWPLLANMNIPRYAVFRA
jgi:hypothetical protein